MMIHATCLVALDADDNNTFHNLCYGIKISKPEKWKFENYQNLLKSDIHFIYKNEEMANKINECPTSYCVLITRYNEPYDGLNPILKVTPVIIKDYANVNPTFILKTYLSLMNNFFNDFSIVQGVNNLKIDGNTAYQVKAKYSVKDNLNRTFRINSGMTIVIKDSIGFVIQTTCAQDGDDLTDKQFDFIINSIKFD